MSDEVAAHVRSVAGRVNDDVLPPPYPTCLGCGPDAPQGCHLQVRRDGDGSRPPRLTAGWGSGG